MQSGWKERQKWAGGSCPNRSAVFDESLHNRAQPLVTLSHRRTPDTKGRVPCPCIRRRASFAASKVRPARIFTCYRRFDDYKCSQVSTIADTIARLSIAGADGSASAVFQP